MLARGSSILSARWREAFGLRPPCRRFGIARDHCCPSKKREQAPRTPNAGAPFIDPRPALTRSVWTASGLPALWHRPRRLPASPKSGSKLRVLQTLARPSLRIPQTHPAFASFCSLPDLNPFQKELSLPWSLSSRNLAL